MFMPSGVAAASGGLSSWQLIAGANANYQGFDIDNSLGSINPDNYEGFDIDRLVTENTPNGAAQFRLSPAGISETIWNTIAISGVFATGGQQTIVWDRVADNFAYTADVSGKTRWRSITTVSPLMVDGNEYKVVIEA